MYDLLIYIFTDNGHDKDEEDEDEDGNLTELLVRSRVVGCKSCGGGGSRV